MVWKAKTKMEQKIEFIHQWLTQKYTSIELSRSFNVSLPTAYKLISRYEKMGLSGLIEQKKLQLLIPTGPIKKLKVRF